MDTTDRVFRWIYLALATGEFNSEALFAKKEPTGERALYLHTPTLEKNWTLVMPERERPSSVDFRNSMRQVAPARTKIALSSAASNKERYKNVRVANLDGFSAWLSENDHDLDLDEALTALAKIRTLK
jgi:hypothetical protein